MKILHPECFLFRSSSSRVQILQTRRPRSPAYYSFTQTTHKMFCDAQNCCHNVCVKLLWIYCSRKKMGPKTLVALIAHHTQLWRHVMAHNAFMCRVPVILWARIFTAINPNFIAKQKECGGLFLRHLWRQPIARMIVGSLSQRISMW